MNVNLSMAKGTRNRMAVVVIVLFAFLLAGLAIGGTAFSLEVLKNLLVGIAIGSAIKLVLMLVGRSKKFGSALKKPMRMITRKGR